MGVWDKFPETARGYLYFGSVGVLILAAVVIANREWGATGLEVANIAISGYLTAALVWLYKEQAETLDSQRELLVQELNREAREKHTEALREVIQVWHGNTDRESPNDSWDGSHTNLPSIGKTSFSSAPTGESTFHEQEIFRVTPYHLENDRYLKDLLENHAPDLMKKKETIEELHDEFISIRNQFEKEFHYDGAVKGEAGTLDESYRVEPASHLVRWVFDFLVVHYRRNRDPQTIGEYAAAKFRREVSYGGEEEESLIWIRSDIPSLGIEGAIFVAKFTSYPALPQTHFDSLREDGARLTQQAVEESDCKSKAEEAAEILEKAQEEITELESLLIEYAGKPIFTGDCQYLQEARIENAVVNQ